MDFLPFRGFDVSGGANSAFILLSDEAPALIGFSGSYRDFWGVLHWDLALGSLEAALEQGKLCRSGCELPKSWDGEAGQVLTPLCGASPAAGSQGGAGNWEILELGSSGAFTPTRLWAQP